MVAFLRLTRTGENYTLLVFSFRFVSIIRPIRATFSNVNSLIVASASGLRAKRLVWLEIFLNRPIGRRKLFLVPFAAQFGAHAKNSFSIVAGESSGGSGRTRRTRELIHQTSKNHFPYGREFLPSEIEGEKQQTQSGRRACVCRVLPFDK